MGQARRKAYGLYDLVRRLPVGSNMQYYIQFILFIAIGSFVGIAFTQPSNAAQAIAAGLAWTSLCTSHQREAMEIERPSEPK
jgi:hypothetical protein